MSRSRLLSFLAMLAALLMPLAMIGAGPAAAMPHHEAAVSSAEHCPDIQPDEQAPQRLPAIDCAMACAALPSFGIALADPTCVATAAEPGEAPAGFDGVDPEATTPPPRFS